MEIIYFCFYVIILISLILLFFRKKNRIQKDYLDPFVLFSGSFFVYTVIGAYDNLYSLEGYYESFLYYLSCMIGYCAFSLGYLYKLRKHYEIVSGNGKIQFTFLPNILHGSSIKKIDAIMLLCLIMCIIMNYDTFISMIVNFGQGVSYVDTAVRTSESVFDGAKSLFHSYFLLFMISFPAYRMFKSNRISVLDIFLYAIYGVYAFASGYRVTLIYLVVTVLAFFNYRRGRLKFVTIGIIACLGIFLLIALGHLRAESNIFDMLKMFNAGGARYFKLSSSGEFVNTVGTFITYINEISLGKYNFNFGYSWIVELLMFVPTFIWPNRPLPLPQQYMKDFFPNALEGTGHGWFILNDGYMAFGIIGIALEMFLLGLILAKAYKFFMNHQRNPLKMVMYSTMLYYIVIMIRNSFLGSLKNYLLFIIPLIIIDILLKPKDDQKCYEN